MCDDFTVHDNERPLGQGISRRQFGAIAGATGMMMALPSAADAMPVSGKDVSIRTADGTADAWFVAPASGRHPGVLMWPDIMGLRPAFQQMARRLAESGYAVLVVNQFYRSTPAPFLKAGESFDQPEVRARITPWRALLTPAATTRDAATFVAFLDAQPQVDTRRGLGSVGYCMGGPMTIRTAAVAPERVHAAASFHGAGLVGDAPDAPNKLIPATKADYLIAIAANDDARAPTDKDVLRAAFAAAHRPAEVEVYPGTMHGWCPPDSKVYNHAQAERGWSRMLAHFGKALA